jgi:hypothetical protein
MLPEPISNEQFAALRRIQELNAFQRIQIISVWPREDLQQLSTSLAELVALIDGSLGTAWFALFTTLDREHRRAALEEMKPQERIILVGQLDKLLDETKRASVQRVISEWLEDALEGYESDR